MVVLSMGLLFASRCLSYFVCVTAQGYRCHLYYKMMGHFCSNILFTAFSAAMENMKLHKTEINNLAEHSTKQDSKIEKLMELCEEMQSEIRLLKSENTLLKERL